MERFASRSNGMLGCSSFQNSFTTPSSSSSSSSSSKPKVPFKNPDIDFDDVFGGPPRRSAMQDSQYSSNEIGDLYPTRVKEESLLNHEKPVFGGAGPNHRRYPSKDFFDDIFRGDELSSPTPRKVDRDPFCSAPGSRVLSPARPLPPRAEPFNSSSIPAQFSLPANLAKGVEFPPFGYGNHSEYRGKDSVSNIMGYTSSSSFPMSRFSSQPIHGLEESRNEVCPFSPHSPFSHKLPLSGKELSRLTNKPNKISAESNLNRDSGTSKVSVNSCQFHFSIYKWASKGAPLIRPFGRRRHLRSKEKVETETWSSSNGGKESYCTLSKLSIESHQVEFGKQGNDLCLKENINARTEDVLGPHQIIEETFLAVLESERIKTLENSIKDDGGEEESSHSHAKEEAPSQSLPDVSLFVKADKEAHKPELKSLHSLLYENTYELGDDGITTKAGRKESMIRTKPPVNIESEKPVNMLDKEEIISTLEADKASTQGSSTNCKDNLGRDELKGKVKTFVNIFSQEASSNPEINIGHRSQSSRWRSREMHEAEKQTSFGSRVMDEEKQSPSKNKKKLLADAPAVIGGKFKQKGKENSGIKDTVHKRSDSGYEQKNGSASASAGSETALNMEESFQEAFLMLSPDQHLQRSRKDHEEIQVSDAKIEKWSSGKEGNIRSLLSTLQFVLWADSGWKPVPLVDIIEANAIKRAYQKALLCLHPDKLQQKGAASHQKYLAGKVFDILQEAWIHFNSLAD